MRLTVWQRFKIQDAFDCLAEVEELKTWSEVGQELKG